MTFTLGFVLRRSFHSSLVPRIVLARSPPDSNYLATWRAAGDKCVLLEYGPPETEDLNRRFRIQFLYDKLLAMESPRLYCTPGVCSLQIRFNPEEISINDVVKLLVDIEKDLPDPRVTELKIPSRKVHLPIAFFDKWNAAAVERYTRDFPKARNLPYLPDNAEFVARANALENKQQIVDFVTRSPYVVLGLGDVYLGAPCAFSLDPTSRLTIPKYNPARTFTPEGSVGLGGSYLCIYPMESPGGYQLIGRTVPIWNLSLNNPAWKRHPWLLRYFDQIIFHQVSENELEMIRSEVSTGNYNIKIEPTVFSTKEYNDDFSARRTEIEAYQTRQRQSLKIVEEEIDRVAPNTQIEESDIHTVLTLADDEISVFAPATGGVAKLHVKVGDKVQAQQLLVTLNAMKMEMHVHSDVTGEVTQILTSESSVVHDGSTLVVIKQLTA